MNLCIDLEAPWLIDLAMRTTGSCPHITTEDHTYLHSGTYHCFTCAHDDNTKPATTCDRCRRHTNVQIIYTPPIQRVIILLALCEPCIAAVRTPDPTRTEDTA